MTASENYKKLVEKVHQAAKDNKLDLSRDEDLSIAIMNLVGIEEHLFFTAEKTNKDSYFKILNEVREMRKELMKKIVKDPEGEVWCISKHLLSASMRLMEVGTKHLNKGEDKEAKDLFEKAFNLYSLFWALNLKMVDTKTIKDKQLVPPSYFEKESKEFDSKVDSALLSNKKAQQDSTFFSKMSNAFKKAIDCCKE